MSDGLKIGLAGVGTVGGGLLQLPLWAHPVNWPAYDTHDATVVSMNTVRPRSSTVVIQRADGKPIAV